MQPPKARPRIRSITIELEDGRKRIIEGDELNDPKGGTLVWNDFGAHEMMKSAYAHRGEQEKVAKVERIWEGKQGAAAKDAAVASDIPAVMIKPRCDPEGWP